MRNRDNTAFPRLPAYGPSGLTKRETAAIAAMQGLLANHEASASIQEDAIEAGIHPADCQ